MENQINHLAQDSGDRTEFDTGALRDRPSGKGKFVLISPVGLRRLALRCEQGHLKYGDGRNWEKGMPISEFIDSALRHLTQYIDGQNDEDHLAAAMWNIQCAMHMEEKMPEMQDLPLRRGLMSE
ncbi:hypothetical protein D3C76_1272980 [compost metagenome]